MQQASGLGALPLPPIGGGKSASKTTSPPGGGIVSRSCGRPASVWISRLKVIGLTTADGSCAAFAAVWATASPFTLCVEFTPKLDLATSRPNRQSEKSASLKAWMPNGIVMISRHMITPASM
jgi:hypothetical protein